MSTFWIQKFHIFKVPHLPKINPGYGPAFPQLVEKKDEKGFCIIFLSWPETTFSDNICNAEEDFFFSLSHLKTLNLLSSQMHLLGS